MHMRKNKFRHPLHALIHINCHIFSFINPSPPDPGREKKINLNFYFHTSLWCFKRFYKGLKGVHKTFRGTTKKCEKKLS